MASSQTVIPPSARHRPAAQRWLYMYISRDYVDPRDTFFPPWKEPFAGRSLTSENSGYMWVMKR